MASSRSCSGASPRASWHSDVLLFCIWGNSINTFLLQGVLNEVLGSFLVLNVIAYKELGMKTMFVRSTLSCFVFSAIFISSLAWAQSSDSVKNDRVPLDSVVKYVQQTQLNRRAVDMRVAPIKSIDDLNSYLANDRLGNSPLDRLSPGAKARFLSSLKFNSQGLTEYNYSELVTELSPTEIYQILSLFGVQSSTSLLKGADVTSKSDRAIMATPALLKDHKDYRCSGRATCHYNMSTICTSNC